MVQNTTVRLRATKAVNRSRAQSMLSDPTDSERKFWYAVRDRRLNGIKFKRQVLVGPYIVDFASLEGRIIVELDGGQHARQQNYDEARDRFLAEKGYRVLRFWNGDVLKNLPVVLETIEAAFDRSPSP